MREATVHIPHSEFEKLGLESFVSLYTEAGLRELSELVCRSPGCILVVEVASRLAEADLSDLAYVEWWERVEETAAAVVYLCKIDVDDLDSRVEPSLSPDVSNQALRVDDDGVEVSLVGSQDGIASSVGDLAEDGVNVDLRRMTDYEGPADALDALTDRQQEILRAAYESGYYDVPRSASAAAVADGLDLDPSTVTEHLQRAEHNLLRALLERNGPG